MTDNMEPISPTDETGNDLNQGDTNTQEAVKTFTQEELNAIVAKRVAQAGKKFEGINLEEYHELKAQQEKAENDRLLKREEFDKLLKQQKDKYDSEVGTLRSELERVKLDGTLQSAASRLKTTNPDHVAQLLRGQIKLDEAGNPVVVDGEGNVRYDTDTAEPYTIDRLVEDFVNENPYFRSAGKAGTGSSGNTANLSEVQFDISQLDLTKAADRAKYAELKRTGKI